MKTIITLTISLFAFIFSYAQTPYEKGMAQGLELWKNGKNTEAVAIFERIASVETNNYLPNYYIAFINITQAFQTKDEKELNNLLTKAQNLIDLETSKNSNNAEIMVLQAMLHTAWIASNPMVYGISLSPKVMGIYTKASYLAPENPRVVFCKAEFEIGGAKWTGANVANLCKQVEKSIQLFATFKPESQFAPNWGLERAEQVLATCKK
jgi:hypothetical protein